MLSNKPVNRSEYLYEIRKQSDGTVNKNSFLDALSIRGIQPDDPRLSTLFSKFESLPSFLTKEEFIDAIEYDSAVIECVLTQSNVLRNFEQFSTKIRMMYSESLLNSEGKLCTIIPQLANQNPNHFAVSICTIDGMRLDVGQTCVDFLMQSCVKPISYCIALEELGLDVHNHVGRENSGERNDVLQLMKDGLPHNPLNNSGAIMTGALIRQDLKPADRFDYYTKIWSELTGGFPLGFSNSAYLSERSSNDNIYALAHFMRESNAFPKGVDLEEVIEFYFQTYALKTNTNRLSIVAASLANGGVCPLTGQKVFSPETVKKCLSVMYACGLHDYSGEFAFTAGLPACSGESGAIICVVPNVMGICTFSPLLDNSSNSARGIEFFSQFTKHFNFHMFDDEKIMTSADKVDPRTSHDLVKVTVEKIIKCSSFGDLIALMTLRPSANEMTAFDYDHRTPLHVAATNGHLHIVEYILDVIGKHHINPLDRWKCTPYDNALREKHMDVVEYLRQRGGKSGIDVIEMFDDVVKMFDAGQKKLTSKDKKEHRVSRDNHVITTEKNVAV